MDGLWAIRPRNYANHLRTVKQKIQWHYECFYIFKLFQKLFQNFILVLVLFKNIFKSGGFKQTATHDKNAKKMLKFPGHMGDDIYSVYEYVYNFQGFNLKLH